MVVVFVLQMIGGRSLQIGLDQFFGGVTGRAGFTRTVTKSALSQARKKLKPSAFAALCSSWVRQWLAAAGEPLWHGLRVVAADGSCVRVPSWRETQDAYGPGPSKDYSVVMARVVGMFAVSSKQMLHVEIAGYNNGERSLLVRCLSALSSTDLLVMDRGYPAWWLFALLEQKGISFCARLDSCGCARNEVTSFLRSGQNETIIERPMQSRIKAQFIAAGGVVTQSMTMRIRLVRVVLASGRIEVLATSLLDMHAYPANSFAALYGSRWKIEEAFKTLKHRLHLEGFTGELPDAIEQEIHAKVLIANITAALTWQAQQQLPETSAAAYQVNQTIAIKHWPELLMFKLKNTAHKFEIALQEFISMLTASLNCYRPNRVFPRRFSVHGAATPRRAYH